jgi:imidazoleglycerol phosphate dehydratase HisB
MTIEIVRTTSESRVVVTLDRGPRDVLQRDHLDTPLPFFNHMLEHIAWRGQVNLSVTVSLDRFALHHLVTEDVGIALGEALRAHVQRRASAGVVGYGCSAGVIDESLARAVVAFESRALFVFDPGTTRFPETVEGLQTEDLVAFYEGLVQGARATVHLDVVRGREGHGHHLWEACFRAFGGALYEALEERAWRAGMTAGVAGGIDVQVRDV